MENDQRNAYEYTVRYPWYPIKYTKVSKKRT